MFAKQIHPHRVNRTNANRLRLPLLFVAALLLFSFGVLAQPAYAATLTVDTLTDENDGSCADGDCSLRDALAVAVAGDTITFDAALSGGTITLNGTQLTIDTSVTISGSGAERPITVSGDSQSRVFDLTNNAIVTIDSLTIQDGNSGNSSTGGGIRVNSGSALTLLHSTIRNSSGRTSGAIDNSGTLLVENSTLSGNQSTVNNGGAMVNRSMATIVNSTISGNTSNKYGGGFYNASGATLVISHTTVTDNQAASGAGGITSNASATETRLYASIVAGNNGSGDDLELDGATNTFVSDGYNLIGTQGSSVVIDSTGDQTGVTDARLGALAENGGATQTHALLPGSPAIDAADNANCPATDQRGETRPFDGDGDGTATCDIGAFESQTTPTFKLDTHSPITNAINVPLTSDVTATFNADVATNSVVSTSFAAHTQFGGLLTGTLSVAGDTVTLNPNRDLFMGEQVQIIATGELNNTTGISLLNPTQWGFTAGHTGSRCVTFVEVTGISNVLQNVLLGSVAWGDYDNDGDLDILLTGGYDDFGSNRVSAVYENNGNSGFSEVTAISNVLTDVFRSSVAWGDYDNDGDLDILLTGEANNGNVSEVYENDGNGGFANAISISNALTDVDNGSVAWVDYDNDGDLDIFLSGNSSGGDVAEIYENDGMGGFSKATAISNVLTGVHRSSVAWGDYDNDGDLDILLTGATSQVFSGPLSKVYENDGTGGFSEATAISNILTDVFRSSVSWGDYDNDGDLDILLTGEAHNSNVSEVYENDGNGGFTNAISISSVLPGVSWGSVVWGDYDNDGDLDILLTGHRFFDNGAVSEVYRNDGDGGFTNATSISNVLPDATLPDVAWGDYDNDGDLDILMTGSSGSYVYRNDDCVHLEKTASSAFASVGETVTYTVIIQNQATVDTTGATVSDTLPAGMTFVPNSTTLEPAGAGTIGDAPTLVSGLTITAGTSVTVTYQATVDVQAGGQTLTNTVAVTDTQGSAVSDTATIDVPAPFLLTAHMPITHALNVPLTSDVTATFDADVAAGSVVSTSFAAHTQFGGLLTGTLSVAGDTVTLNPDRDLFAGEQVQVIATNDINSMAGTGLTNPTQWGFTAGSVINRCVAGFTDIGAGLTGVYDSSVAWGDYDNDGDLDILLTGRIGIGRVSKVYRNDGGSFTDIGAGLTGVSYSSVAWGDYDNDGDLDILLAGRTGSGRVSKVYRNDGGSFTDIGAGMTGVNWGSVAWGDYDNDGDLDILLSGSTDSVHVSKVYRNDGGSFTDIGAGLTAVFYSSVAWGDYDNDGDLDILLSGQAGSGRVSKVYRNDGGSFTNIGAGLTAVRHSSVAWGDYDNDGDLDILLSGQNSSGGRVSKVYRNDGGSFTDIGAGLTAVGWSSVAWGDYDNDGDLDILLSGLSSSGRVSRVYRNDGGNFSNIGAGLTAVELSSVAWGDYDNDGDLDILLTGSTGSGRVSKVYRNDDCVPGLSVQKTASSATVEVGDTVTYTVVVANSGLVSATGAIISDTLPSGMTFVANSTTLEPAGAGTIGDGATGVAATLVSGLTITNGTSVTVTYQATVDVQAGGQTLTNTVGVTDTQGSAVSDTATIDVPTPFRLTAHTPITNALNVPLTSDVTATFDADVAAGSVVSTSFAAHTQFGGLLTGTLSVAGDTVTLNPDRDLFAGEQVQVIATNDIISNGGVRLTNPTQWGFTAGSVTNRCAGGFTNIGAGLTGVYDGSVAWGDYDNDGDLDILLVGYTGSGRVSKVYRNDGGSFSDIGAGLTAVDASSVAWGDYDNDGDLDILLSGSRSGSRFVSKVYRNDGGSFSDIGAGLTAVDASSVAWGDYDNDGDLDILLSGWSSSGLVSQVYRNDGGSFTDIGAGLTAVGFSSVAWGDYDNDGDLDILLTGQTTDLGRVAKVYRNDGGSFTDIGAGLTGVYFSSVAWGDYDNDGDLDILLSGRTGNANRVSKVYRNDGGSFTDTGAGLTAVYESSVAWGDYDNDGDLDILLTGQTTGLGRVSKVYRNDGGSFTNIGAGLTGVEEGSVAWGDYDNDGDLDILLSGQTGSSRVSKVYRNDDCVPELTVEKTASSATVAAGETVTYTVVVANSGLISATGAVISDTLPAGMTFVANSTALDPADAGTTSDAPIPVSGLTIAAGTSVTVTYQVTVDAGTEFETLINTVGVTDAEGSDESDTAGVTVLCSESLFPFAVSSAENLDKAIRCFNSFSTPDSYTISFTNDISLTTALPTIDNDTSGALLTIEGNGHALDGQNSVRLFTINPSAPVQIRGLTMMNGSADAGGAIESSGTLTVENSTLVGNQATVDGGAIVNYGQLTVRSSTIAGNSAVFGGGGVRSDNQATIENSTIANNTANTGGGIQSLYDLSVVNSTISGNTANVGGGLSNSADATFINSTISGNTANAGGGGGLFNASGTVVISYTTIADNHADDGAGIRSDEISAETHLYATIVVSNTGGNDLGLHGSSGTFTNTFKSQGYNLIGTLDSTVVMDGTDDQTGVADAMLGALVGNGGDTLTHALLAGSPAINGADNANCPATDQRGVERPQSGICDIGAFERINTPPVAVDNSYTTDEDSPLSGNIITDDTGAGTDSDSDGLTLTIAENSDPSDGTLNLNADGSFVYTPTLDFSGVVTFAYAVSNGVDTSETATVTITVNAVNDAPVAVDNSYATEEDTAVTGNVITDDTGEGVDNDGGDGGALSIAENTEPADGMLSLSVDGSFVYTPTLDFNGVVTFTYSISDGTDTSDAATVTITVNAVNDAPVAVDNSYATEEDTAVSGNVITDDTGEGLDSDGGDGGALSIAGNTEPASGTLNLNADGSFVYTPTLDFSGVVSFTYLISDGTDTSEAATVTITVNAVNDAPVAVDNSYVTEEDTAVSGNVITDDTGEGLDSDGGDGGALSIAGNSEPASGMLVLNADGSFVYTPTVDFFGVVSFTYSISDGTDTSEAATVTIAVNDVAELSVADVVVDEGAGNVMVVVSIAEATSRPVTFTYSTADDSAIAPDDYTTISGTATIAVGETEVMLTVPIVDDAIVEGDEMFSMVLSAATHATIEDDTATVTITDDDAAELSVADVVVDEIAGTATVTVTSSAASTTPITVQYTTQDGTAIAGQDYEAVSGTITFTAGVTMEVVSVIISADSLDEPQEAFTILLSDATGATIDDDSGTVTINDSNDAVGIRVTAPVSVSEEAGVVTFTVTLDEPSGFDVGFDFATMDGTAVADGSAVGGSGYVSATGRLTITASMTQTEIPITILDDLIAEVDSAFSLEISNVSNATTLSGRMVRLAAPVAQVEISDAADRAAVSITVLAPTTAISEGMATQMTVTLGTMPAVSVTIMLTTTDATECVVSPSEIVLDAGNYSTGVVFTAIGTMDHDSDGDQPCTVVTTVVTGDQFYAAESAEDITLTIKDYRPTAVSLRHIEAGAADRSQMTIAFLLLGWLSIGCLHYRKRLER